MAGKEDWYRNIFWDPWTSAVFERRLARKRNKDQYLRIQACCLTLTSPWAALRLLERYFELKDRFDDSRAYIDQSRAWLTLGQSGKAIDSLRQAAEHELATERGISAGAPVYLARLVAIKRRSDLYEEAFEALERHAARGPSDMFPIDRYLRHGARALVLDGLGRSLEAGVEARLAVEAAADKRSASWKHPGLGFVGPTLNAFGRRIRAVAYPAVSPPVRMLIGLGWLPRPSDTSDAGLL